MDTNDRKVLKAFAKVYVNNKKELLDLLIKYGYVVSPNDAEFDLLVFIGTKSSNSVFDKEFTQFLIDRGGYNSGYKNAIAALIAGAVTSISTMLGQVVGQAGRTDTDQLQVQSETQQALLLYLSQEKEIKAQKERTNIFIFGGVAIAITVVFAIIFINKK